MARSLIPSIELERGSFAVDPDSLLERLYETSSIHRECLVAASAVAAYFRSLLERSDFARYSEYEYCLHYYAQPPIEFDRPGRSRHYAAIQSRQGEWPTPKPASTRSRFAHRARAHALQRRTVIHLIKIIYDACWIEGALDLTQEYRSEAPEKRLCHCQALSIAGRHKDAEKELSELLSSLDQLGLSRVARSRIQFYAGIVGTFIARVRGDYELARSRYLAISSKVLVADDRCVYYRFGEVAEVSDTAERLAMAVDIARQSHNHNELRCGRLGNVQCQKQASWMRRSHYLMKRKAARRSVTLTRI